MVLDTITRMQNEQDATSLCEMVKIRADQLSLKEPSKEENGKFPIESISSMVTNSQLLTIRKTATIFDRAQFFAAINNVTETFKNRFDQPKYQMYIHLEQTLLKGVVGLDIDQHINMLQTIYKDEYNCIKLKSQLLTLSSSLSYSPICH